MAAKKRRKKTTAEQAVAEILKHLKGPNREKALPKKALKDAEPLLYSMGIFL